MRVLVVMAVYNEEDYIAHNIRNLYPYVDKIAVSTTKHRTGEDSTDNSRQLVENFIKDEDTDNKVILRDIIPLAGVKLDFDT